MKKIAVILFNLGGPDNEQSIEPFLFNLFNDPAIITIPSPFRWMLAKFLSKKRVVFAKKIYAHLGGKSPLLEETLQQQEMLKKSLEKLSSEGMEFNVFTVMRYWKPFSKEVVAQVKNYNPDEVILLPLYPQFSTTTSKSSINDWVKESKKQGLTAKIKTVCCYNTEKNFIYSHSTLLNKSYCEAQKYGNPRIIFSAHGLPKKVIAKGDPYQRQIEHTAAAVIAGLGLYNVDSVVAYQSRVGPLEWLEPSTESEIIRAGNDNVPIVIVPIAFVSEHSETLVELDIEYRKIAENHNVPAYIRVEALGRDSHFIHSLYTICRDTSLIQTEEHYSNYSFACEKCPDSFNQCPNIKSR